MFNYIIRRILATIPLLVAMTFFTFMIVQLAPGDIMAKYEANPQISPETIEAMNAKYHFDKPPIIQYGHWVKNLIKGDMGYSFTMKEQVSTVIGSRLKNTLILSLFSIALTWLVAIPFGIMAAVHQYKIVDKFFSFIAYIGISLPNFFLALLLIYGVSVLRDHLNTCVPFQWIGQGVLYSDLSTGARVLESIKHFLHDIPVFLLQWVPLGGMKSPDYDTLSGIGKFFDVLKHLFIPGIVLGTAAIAGLQRIMRGNMLEELRQKYITTARAKGLPENKVIYKHALRNAINPLITIFGYQFSALLSGAALTEIITSWPGLGTIMLDAVRSQDIFLVMGSLMISGVMLIVGNLIADILLAATDPRIKLS